MASWQPRGMGEHHEAPAGRADAGADGAAPWGGAAAPRLPDPAGYDAGIQGSAQRSVGEPSQARASFGARRRADRLAIVTVQRQVQALVPCPARRRQIVLPQVKKLVFGACGQINGDK